MAFGRSGGSMLSAPRVLTLLASLVLVGLALASFTSHLPGSLAVVKGHRIALTVAGYAVLLAGVLLRQL